MLRLSRGFLMAGIVSLGLASMPSEANSLPPPVDEPTLDASFYSAEPQPSVEQNFVAQQIQASDAHAAVVISAGLAPPQGVLVMQPARAETLDVSLGFPATSTKLTYDTLGAEDRFTDAGPRRADHRQ